MKLENLITHISGGDDSDTIFRSPDIINTLRSLRRPTAAPRPAKPRKARVPDQSPEIVRIKGKAWVMPAPVERCARTADLFN